MIINSFEAKVLAIRKVVTNKGKKTAGTDNITWESPKEYWEAIEALTGIVKNPKEYKASPLRRV